MLDYAKTHIEMSQELKEVYRLANEGDIEHALQKAVDVRELASDLVYTLSRMRGS